MRRTKLSTKYMRLRYGMRGALDLLEALIDEPTRAHDSGWSGDIRRFVESQRLEHRYKAKP